jgi:hypothetical protein
MGGGRAAKIAAKVIGHLLQCHARGLVARGFVLQEAIGGR